MGAASDNTSKGRCPWISFTVRGQLSVIQKYSKPSSVPLAFVKRCQELLGKTPCVAYALTALAPWRRAMCQKASLQCAERRACQACLCSADATHLGLEELLALGEGATRLDQVVHDDHVPAARGALLQAHDALVAVAHLGADDLRQQQ